MATLVPTVGALAVSTIYCVWHTYRLTLVDRQRVLRERVAYMLWVAATLEDRPAA
jgi:hypothetical protein